MKVRDVVIGLIVLIALIAGALYLKNRKTAPATSTPTPNYQTVESKFPGLTVPVNADRASLTDVTGGQGMGEAIKGIKNGMLSLTVLANLETPKPGYFYQAWLANDNSYISLGKMELAKGGYLVDFSSSKYYSDYKKVVVTLEKVFNNTPETHILEGSF
jgi:hypothetical protein